MKSKILIFSSRLPYPLMGGDRIRIYNTCKLLAQHYIVDLLVVGEKDIHETEINEVSKLGVNVIPFPHSSIRSKMNALFGILSSLPLQVQYYYFKDVQQWIDSHVKEYDFVFCNHIRTGEYLKGKNIPKLIDLHDAISLNYARAYTYASGLWKWIYAIEKKRVLRYEIEMIRTFEKAIIVSAVDKDFLVRHGADPAKLTVLPVAVDKRFDEVYRGQENDSITFVGKMNTVANADAAEYFATMIFPEIKKKAPKTEFFIVGADPTPRVSQLSKLEGVTVTGKVEDHIAYIRQSKVIVAPMRFGAGMQNKILEAMALGKPVVTTTIGAEGIDGADGVHFLIGDSAEDFSRQILRLLGDAQLRQTIGNAAHDLIQEKYTWDVVGQSLLKLIQHSLNETE